jgi:hypothetical protein
MRGYGMDIVHFTPGMLAYDKPRPSATAAIMPLAGGKGKFRSPVYIYQ